MVIDIDHVAVLNAILRKDLSSFIQRSFPTVDPGTTYLHNWHAEGGDVALTPLYLVEKDLKRGTPLTVHFTAMTNFGGQFHRWPESLDHYLASIAFRDCIGRALQRF